MQVNELITSDPDILSGQTVFAGTRVPVETLFDHLEAGIPLDEFLDDFPTVSKEQAVALLEAVSKLLTDKNIRQVYVVAQ
ncbi:DUF433 domain-containing protein [Hymenobacter baengnokdamensis]|uniref:DUF433 domain-containing protein n=1 Tax=Hymenobacter baengnokdamensis TaxID=2615203 RepID=UPI001246C45B|nr:DUF433 domain-containing protein [Hymenobacter baengnokdamensis]